MSQWLPAPGDKHRVWKIVAMHHPAVHACAPARAGSSASASAATSDEPGLQKQLQKTLEDLEPPDLMLAAHNHIYARSHPLDAEGKPVTSGKGGVRYFVTGGGGGPVYAVRGADSRFPKALDAATTSSTSAHRRPRRSSGRSTPAGRVKDSGCFEKGSNVDFPLSPDFNYDDSLPSRCGAPAGS